VYQFKTKLKRCAAKEKEGKKKKGKRGFKGKCASESSEVGENEERKSWNIFQKNVVHLGYRRVSRPRKKKKKICGSEKKTELSLPTKRKRPKGRSSGKNLKDSRCQL